jgi:hypothetical protein
MFFEESAPPGARLGARLGTYELFPMLKNVAECLEKTDTAFRARCAAQCRALAFNMKRTEPLSVHAVGLDGRPICVRPARLRSWQATLAALHMPLTSIAALHHRLLALNLATSNVLFETEGGLNKLLERAPVVHMEATPFDSLSMTRNLDGDLVWSLHSLD